MPFLGKKTDSMRFSSEHRADIITETMKFKHEFGERQKVHFIARWKNKKWSLVFGILYLTWNLKHLSLKAAEKNHLFNIMAILTQGGRGHRAVYYTSP